MRVSIPLVLAIAAGACVPADRDVASEPASGQGGPAEGGPAADEFSAVLPDWCSGLPRAAYASLDRVPLEGESWFEVYSVGDRVYAIYEPMQWQEVISYLIVGSESAVLFDSGMGIASIRGVVSRLWDGSVSVVNSHTHFDHIGGNHEFDRILAMDTDYTRENSRGAPNEEVREELAADALCGPLPGGITEENFVSHPWEIAESIRDGHESSLGDRTLEVLHIPGHTDDAIALIERDTGYLWTGDSFYEGPIWLFWPGTDLEAYRRSTETLAALAPELTRVFPAHNTPVAQPARLIELRDAFAGALDGSLGGTRREDGLMVYDVGSFSLLLQPPDRR